MMNNTAGTDEYHGPGASHDCLRVRRALRAFREVLADEGSTPCSPKRFLIVSNSRSVSLPKRFSATMTGKP
jgi:hypothetical protein